MNEEDGGRKESKVVIKVKKGTSKGLAKLALENMLVNRVVRFARRNGANAGALTHNLFYKGQAIFQPVMSLNFFSRSSSLVPSLSPIISNLESLPLKLITIV